MIREIIHISLRNIINILKIRKVNLSKIYIDIDTVLSSTEEIDLKKYQLFYLKPKGYLCDLYSCRLISEKYGIIKISNKLVNQTTLDAKHYEMIPITDNIENYKVSTQLVNKFDI